MKWSSTGTIKLRKFQWRPTILSILYAFSDLNQSHLELRFIWVQFHYMLQRLLLDWCKTRILSIWTSRTFCKFLLKAYKKNFQDRRVKQRWKSSCKSFQRSSRSKLESWPRIHVQDCWTRSIGIQVKSKVIALLLFCRTFWYNPFCINSKGK